MIATTNDALSRLLSAAPSNAPGTAIHSQPAEVVAASSHAGNRYGKYVRVALLGRGGMGDVWKAWDGDLSRWVALKFPRLQNAAHLTRLRREASAAAQVLHPNVAAVYEIGQARGTTFIAMQYVEGTTLFDRKEKDRRAIVGFLRDAALGAAHLHERGLVHRDLKPANIMIDRASGRAIVMDLGLARFVRTSDPSTAALGTPLYASPEQALGNTIDERSDVWSLGVSLYELLSGKPPFMAKTVPAILAKVVEAKPAPLAVDRRLRAIVERCMQKAPAGRYTTCRALADDLDAWLKVRPPVARRVVIGLGLVALAIGLIVRWPQKNAVVTVEKVEAKLDLVERAEKRMRDADLVGALSDCASVLAVEPRNAPARALRARILLVAGNLHAALAEAEEAIRCEERAESYQARGIVRQARGDAEGAMADFQKALTFRR